MAYNTVIQQGYFTSDGNDKVIPLRSDVDWVEVTNLTNIAASTQWAGCTWFWQRGMTQDDATTMFHAAATQAMSMSTAAIGYNGATYRGISVVDSTDKTPGAAVAVTAGTNAVAPVYSTADTGNIQVGSIVRVTSTAHNNLNGLDFTVGAVTAGTTFTLSNDLATAPGVIAGAGFYRLIAPNVTYYDMFHPKTRNISNITQAAAAVVTTLVDHNYTTGDKVRMAVPAEFGMVELDGQLGTVTVIDAGTFSIDIDTTAYTAFAYILAAAAGDFTSAQVIPMGVDPANNTSTTSAVENTGFIGFILGTGTDAASRLAAPGGTNGDAIKWRAGKSFAYDIG